MRSEEEMLLRAGIALPAGWGPEEAAGVLGGGSGGLVTAHWELVLTVA